MENRKRKYPGIQAAQERAYYPLSFQQERILYLSRLLPENTYWNRISTKQLKGKIDIPLLKNAIGDLANRHPVIKTRIQLVNNAPVQSCTASKDRLFECVDLYSQKEARAEQEALNLLYKECRTPIDVNDEHLFKALLIPYDRNEYLLILKLHHIITDATSFHILWRDLKLIYNAYTDNSLSLPEMQITYYDYALWQREAFAEKNIQEQEAYWLNEFRGEIPVLDLPADFPPSREMSFRGAMEKTALPGELVKALLGLSLQKRVILFSTLLAAYSILLKKYCGQEDMIVGTVFSGRQYDPAIKNMAGFFINTVAVRMNVEDGLPFEQLLIQIHQKVDQAYFMQDYPFEKIIQKINPDRGSRTPLFRTIFNMVNSYKETAGFPGIEEENWIPPEINAAQIDILMEIHNHNNEALEIRIEYSTAIFKKETIKDLLKHYVFLLSGLVKNPAAKIRELVMIDLDEQKQFLSAWNNTFREFPAGKTLHGLFEEQAEKTPDAPAVLCGAKQITYRELNGKANRLARHLRSKGAVPNQLIGIVLDRSIDMIVSVLGVLKAGAAYLPIEPGYPAERIHYILENSKAAMVITQSGHKHVIDSKFPVILIDETDGAEYPADNPTGVNATGDLAYTIYTSGSTGKPKGVMITHQAVVNTIQDINSKFSVHTKDRIIGLSSLSFDLSVYDIFGTLAAGAALVQIKDQRDIKETVAALENHGITIWNSVPAIMDMLLENIKEPFSSRNMRLVLLSGDWIPLTLPAKIKRHFPNAELISLGGATEASIWSIYYPVKEVKEEWSSIPYGNPLANQTFYVLDNAMKLCPAGIRGELYIGGTGLAKGYMNEPEKTKNSFINHPEFGSLYRTGDWGKFHNEGYIEFLGRKDQQVKIRGYRIELGEIEKTLLSYHTVREAVAIVREDIPGNRRITAYLVLDPSVSFTESELQAYLGKWLPPYMIPSSFVVLETLPLSSNGKVDIKALPAPDTGAESAGGYKAPVTAVEKKLVEISENILNVRPIGLNDNFFRIGGNSLLTIRFISEIEEAFGIQLTMLDFIDLPVISEIVKKIDTLLPSVDTEEDVLEEQLAYWRGQLEDAPRFLELPLDRSRSAVQEYQVRKEFFEIHQDLADQLKRMGRQLYVSLSMILTTAFSLLLWHKSKQEDIVTGIPVITSSDDDDEQCSTLLNPDSKKTRWRSDRYMNILPLRINLSGNPAFPELLSRVRAATLDAYANQDPPFARLLKVMNIEPGTGHFPLFQAVCAFQNEPGGVVENIARLTNYDVKPDLVLSVADPGQELAGCWEYNSCLFDDSTVRQMKDQYMILLEQITGNTDTNIVDLQLDAEPDSYQMA
ncbi:MAG: amino acid adenylation domain-containing protein [Spirochaetales bacterium]|nr:amino acid adenylation domain-containing protein [Spirochaetales bacterium]